jgi:hypothetical protein
MVMTLEEKKYLIDLLTESQSANHAIVQEIDPDMRVYKDPDWRVRDILGHLATWDRQVTKSLRAYQSGTEYAIPDLDEDESEFNQQAVLDQRRLNTEQVLAEMEQAREDFKQAVSDISDEKFPGDLLYPWGDERGSIAKLVEYMVEHDAEHRNEIKSAILAS